MKNIYMIGLCMITLILLCNIVTATEKETVINQSALINLFGTADTKIIKDSIFTTLKSNDAQNKEAVFTMNSTKLSSNDDLSIIFNEVCGHVNSYDLVIPKTCTKTETYCYLNYTKENLSKEICQEILIDYDCSVPYTKESVIKDVKITNVKMTSGWCLIGDKYYTYAIDWKPSINIDGNVLVDDKWAWWNVTGGTITYDGNYTVHTFTSNGTFNTTATINATVLIVAGGGGGGGQCGGGGGAGGIIYNTSYIITPGTIDVIVGTGGLGGATGVNHPGTNGTNSSFGVLKAKGGGGGGAYNGFTGQIGGSGGGSGYPGGGVGTGIAGQGNNGGTETAGWCGTGGGGAGTIGGSVIDTTSGGVGGNGTNYSINGTNMYYAGGGGGGGDLDGGGGLAHGGLGGGGAGGYSHADNAIAGTNSTGGGGGGGGNVGGVGKSGGSGIVIIRYLTLVGGFNANTTNTGTYLNNTQNWIYSSVSISITNFNSTNTTISLYDSTGFYASYTNLTGADSISYNFTGLPNGVYYLNATARNGTMNLSTETREIIIYGININITNPINVSQDVIGSLNITYSTTINPVGTSNITYYNISLLNDDETFNQTIIGNNSINLSYYWNTGSTLGLYHLFIELTDSLGNKVNSTSNQINISYNTFNITFRDQDNHSLLVGTNISLDLIGDTYSNNYSTNTSYLTITNVPANYYAMRYYAPDYSTRFYYTLISAQQIQNITFYMILNTAISNVTVTVIDQNANPVQNAHVKALKYDLATNSYLLQEVGITNVQGEVILSLTMYDEYYKFMVEYDGVLETTTTPAYITSNSLTIQILLGDLIGYDYNHYANIFADLTFNTITNNFRLDYDDVDGLVDNVCLEVYTLGLLGETFFNDSCSVSASGTLLVSVIPVNGTTYLGRAYYYEASVREFLDSETYTYPAGEPFGKNYGLLLQVVLTVFCAFLAVWSLPLAALLVPLSLIIGRMLHFNLFGWDAIAAVVVVGLIIAYITRKDS